MLNAPPPLQENLAFFLDVGGILLNFAALPDAVRADSELIGTLDSLHRAAGGALALLSGRRLDDLDRILGPLYLPAAGIHGLERRRADRSVEIWRRTPSPHCAPGFRRQR